MKQKLRSLARRVRERIAVSAWSTILFRMVLLATGLVVLAWIGRVATAAPPPAPFGNVNGGNLGHGDPFAFGVDSGAPSIAASAVATATTTPTSSPSPSARASPPAQTGQHQQPTRASVEDPVYLNHAGVEDLRRLPGVGPKRADAILALRQRVGRFQRVEDLLRVKGVGRATLRKWRPLVRLDAPPAPPTSPAASADAGD